MRAQVWVKPLIVAAGIAAVLLPLSSVQAAPPFARSEHRGFFLNRADSWGDSVLSGGVHPVGATQADRANSFISIIEANLGGGSSQNRTGAEFIILTMMGYAPGTNRAIAHNGGVLADWRNRVRYYAQQGWVDWSANYSWTYNTYWQGNSGGHGGGQSNPNDDAWYTENGSTDDAILFHHPGTTHYYAIRKPCANPIGDYDALQSPSYSMSLTTSAPTTTVMAGDTVNMSVQLTNAGPANSEVGVLQIMHPGATAVNMPCAPNCTPPAVQQTNFSPPVAASARGFRNASSIPGRAGVNWYWNTTVWPSGRVGTAAIQFTISNTATPATLPGGFDLCAYYTPANTAHGTVQDCQHFTVITQRTPYFVGQSGDIHAGGGLCLQTSYGGNVQGRPGSLSYGDYMVSATGTISGVRSNGSGADQLKISGSIPYCRTDLYSAVAQPYRISGATDFVVRPAGSPNFDLTADNTSTYGLYYLEAPTAYIHGNVATKTTIVARGDVVIDGPIALTGSATDPRQMPSLGIIAAGNIYIRAGVTRVDAYLFASTGVINTCQEANNSCSTATLVVNGFLMAHDILFNRLGPANTNGNQLAEQIRLNPQLYLNPPRFFDSSIDDILLRGQGEQQPLY